MASIEELKTPTKVMYRGMSGYCVRVGDTKVRINWGDGFVATYNAIYPLDKEMIKDLQIVREEDQWSQRTTDS